MEAIWQRIVRPRHEAATDSATTAPARQELVQFVNASLVTEDGLRRQGELWVQGGHVVDPQARFWQREAKATDRRIDCKGMLLAPGMIDIMLYGAFGVDFSALGGEGDEATAEAERAVSNVCARLPEIGVTAFCPAVRPCSPATYTRLLERLVPPQDPPQVEGVRQGADGGSCGSPASGARLLGVHLDGPFLSREYAPDPKAPVRERVDGNALHDVFGAARLQSAAVVTIAPELPGALDAIRELSARGVVVGIGRTGATLAQSEAAMGAGARLVTHALSSMPPFHHRDPGPIGVLASCNADGAGEVGGSMPQDAGAEGEARVSASEVFFSMAVVGQHAAPTVNLARAVHPDGLVLLSSADSSADARAVAKSGDAKAAGAAMVAGDAKAAGNAKAAGAAKPVDGHTLVDGARMLWQCSGTADPAAALLCASAHPARLLGLGKKGSLAPGADADLVLLDPTDLTVQACFVGGQLAWAHPQLHGALWFHS